eukprot:246578-Lingulodinium_polyedra.AAC.1
MPTHHSVARRGGRGGPDLIGGWLVVPSTRLRGATRPLSAKFCQVLPSVAKCCQVLPSVAKFCRVPP